MGKTRFIFIIGTDIEGPQPWWDAPWMVKPWLDNGRLKFSRSDFTSIKNQHFEISQIAKAHGIAVGLRGIADPGWQYMPLLVRASAEFSTPITFLPWIDTGALSDLVQRPFDFANDEDLAAAWDRFIGPFFDVFPTHSLERSKNDRILMTYWGIHPQMGHGMVNLSQCHRLLDYVAAQMVAQDLGEPDAIVADTWTQYDAPVKPFAFHSWFDANKNQNYSITHYNGVKVGVVVPGFHDPPNAPLPHRVIKRENGNRVRQAFEAFKAQDVDYVLWESYNNMIESAGAYRCEPNQIDPETGELKSWEPDTLYLDLTREFVESVSGVNPTPEPSPLNGSEVMIAVSEVKDYKLYEDLIPGETQGTYAMIIGVATDADKNIPGYKPGLKKMYSLQSDGVDGFRFYDPTAGRTADAAHAGTPASWESGRLNTNGTKIIFRTNNHVRMFWIERDL